jgi:hypothetical protein
MTVAGVFRGFDVGCQARGITAFVRCNYRGSIGGQFSRKRLARKRLIALARSTVTKALSEKSLVRLLRNPEHGTLTLMKTPKKGITVQCT